MSTDPSPTNRSGLFSHAVDLISEALEYLRARAILAGIEAKEAGIQFGVAAALVAGALFVAVLGYVLVVIIAVFAIGLAFESEHARIAVLGGTALLHLLGAIALLLGAKNRIGKAPFPETLAEIQKDRIWLRNLISQR